MSPHIPSAVTATFDVLRTSDTVNLPDVLAAALDASREPIQYAAAEVLLERPSVPEHLKLLERLPRLPASVRELAVNRSQTLLPALTFGLLKGSPESRRLALAALRSTGMTAALAHVLKIVLQPESPEWLLAVETLRDIVNRLYDRWQQGATHAVVQPLREQVLNDLEQAAAQCHDESVAEEIATSVLVLGEPNHPVVRNVSWHGAPVLRDVSHRLLLTATHPGILRFLTASLAESYPHPQVFVALRERRDPEFIAAVLRAIASGLTTQHHRNLQQIDRIAWLAPPLDQLEIVPASLQPAIATLLQATRFPRAQKAAVLEWLLRHGTSAARLAAKDGLSLLDESRAKEVIRANIEAKDPAVQAWATLHLRHCGVPEAHVLLVDRLESPHTEVRIAARHELSGFNVPRVLSQAEEWSVEEARRAGRLLLKVDPDAAAHLQRELLHPAKQKRIRTARAILRLGLQVVVADAMLTLAQDSDVLVRRTAAEVLEHIPTPAAADCLEQMLDDDNDRVRAAAAAALERGHRSAYVGLQSDMVGV